MSIADEVRAWLDTNWDTSITLREWWRRLADSGYAFPTWPKELGGLGIKPSAAREINEVLGERGVISPPEGMGPNMAFPTILANGTAEQTQRFARSIATGETSWCQLFSEPGAGSDLAAVGTKAVRDGDEFIVTGQKVWNSGAESADKGMLLARTNPDMPKHRGMSYMIIDMQQPGVEVRPLVQMNRGTEFCEVFLTEARVRVDDVIGGIDNGWGVARTTLAAERSMAASGRSRKMAAATAGQIAGNLDRTVAEVIARWEDSQRDTTRRAGVLLNSRAMISLANKTGCNTDPVTRQDLAGYWCHSEVYRLTNKRVSDNAKAGKVGPEGSIGKLGLAMLAHRSRDLSLRMLGASGMLMDDDAPSGGWVQLAGLSSHMPSIGGGTNEIQRTVIGEQALGLPREPSTDSDIPFKDLLRSRNT